MTSRRTLTASAKTLRAKGIRAPERLEMLGKIVGTNSNRRIRLEYLEEIVKHGVTNRQYVTGINLAGGLLADTPSSAVKASIVVMLANLLHRQGLPQRDSVMKQLINTYGDCMSPDDVQSIEARINTPPPSYQVPLPPISATPPETQSNPKPDTKPQRLNNKPRTPTRSRGAVPSEDVSQYLRPVRTRAASPALDAKRPAGPPLVFSNAEFPLLSAATSMQPAPLSGNDISPTSSTTEAPGCWEDRAVLARPESPRLVTQPPSPARDESPGWAVRDVREHQPDPVLGRQCRPTLGPISIPDLPRSTGLSGLSGQSGLFAPAYLPRPPRPAPARSETIHMLAQVVRLATLADEEEESEQLDPAAQLSSISTTETRQWHEWADQVCAAVDQQRDIISYLSTIVAAQHVRLELLAAQLVQNRV